MSVIKLFFPVFFLSLCVLSAGVKAPRSVEWDFSPAKRVVKDFSLRGKSSFTSQGLHTPAENSSRPGGALLKKEAFPILTPAFSLETEFLLDEVPRSVSSRAMLLGCKYVPLPNSAAQKKYHKGLMLFLNVRGKDLYRPGAAFGYGDESVQITGKDISLRPGVPYVLKLCYSGTSKVEFFLNGKKISTHTVPARSVMPPALPAIFGDRTGSLYQPLGGTLKRVRITEEKFSPCAFSIAPEERRVFERKEKNTALKVQLRSLLPVKAENLTVKALSAGKTLPSVAIKELPSNGIAEFSLPVDSLLLPGEYQLALELADSKGKQLAAEKFTYAIVPAYGDFLPVILWGNHTDIEEIRKAGFTHQMVHLFPRQGNFQTRELKRWIPHLDENLKAGLYTFGNLHGHFRFLQSGRFLRKDKNGNLYPRKNIEASNSTVKKEFADAARSTLQEVGKHPAFDGALINSEVRDSSLPSYGSREEEKAFRKFAGYDIPQTISGKSPPPYSADATFPWDRVISDRRKDYVFLRWFYLTGDGWNDLQTLLSDTMHEAVKGIEHKKRFFTFYDPATRVPPLWGSGGNVDMIGQWTYSYPDPIKIGQATDELLAMAQGRKGQKIGSMTQAIWYRSQTAPLHKQVKNSPAWLKKEPEAQFISISPDNLREAFWSKISRKVDFIMYHGVGSLLDTTSHKFYRYTNDESKKVLAELSGKVIRPLGPVIKRIPEKAPRVAILQSLAASFYAPGHLPFGWSKNWGADLHLALQWGSFQPGILYDEHLLHNKNLENLKVLFVPGLEVVTDKLLAALNRLRARGVIIVGDEFTLPALMVDLRIKSVSRNINDPAGTKKALQALGRELAEKLDKYATREAVSSDSDLVVRQRGNSSADYVFVLNDKRTFGSYVGQWGMVQEKGLPLSGTVTVNRKAEAAYDLVAHKMIPLKDEKRGTSFAVDLAPGDGKMILLLEKAIDKISLELTPALPGRSFTVSCEIKDRDGKNIPAILPVEVLITTDKGVKLPGSGFYAAEKGRLVISEILPTNLPGNTAKINVSVRCLASGKSTVLPLKFSAR